MQICRILISNLILLSTTHALFIGTEWKGLNPKDVDKKVNGVGAVIKGREIVLTQESILNLTTTANPVLEEQYYAGDLKFEDVKTLTLNVNVAAANGGGLTPIYWRKKSDDKLINSFTCGKYQDSDGTCTLNLNIDSQTTILKHLINMEASTLLFSPNVNVTLAPNSKVHSLFVAGVHGSKDAEGTIEFFAGLNVDLRDTQGEFLDPQVGKKRRLIFENFGAAINVNPDRRPFSVKLYGDIYTEGLGTRINLVTPDSIFEGHIDIGNADFNSFTELTLHNGATANITLNYLTPKNANIQSFSLTLQDSTAKLDATLGQTQNAKTNFTLTNSTLYANFNYNSPNRGGQDKVSVDLNQSTWITNKNAYADEVSFGKGGVIDLRFSDFEGNRREYARMNETNRLTLSTQTISGNGTFKLYGILNRNLWDKDAQGNSIATDQIITQSVMGNHSIEIYWDAKNVDESLLSEELIGDRIVVAKQLSTKNEGNFIGAKTPIGLYEYTTNLTKEDLLDNSGAHIGYEWVIGKLQQGGVAPSSPSSPRPSFLSRTLNTLFSIPYKTFLSQTQTLHQRMGDLRYFDSIAGAYFKTNYSLLYDSSSPTNISALTHSEDMLLGADLGVYGFGGKHFFGASLNFTPIQDSGEDGAYSGNSLAYGISIYATSLFNGGFYTDALLKYAYASHQYDLHSQDFSNEALDFSSHYLIGSFEMGYKMKLPIKTPNFDYSFYYLKPQFNLDFGVIFGSNMMSLHHSGGYDVGAKYDLSLPIKPSLSLDFGRRFDNQQILGDVFVTLGAEYGFNAGNTLELSTPYNDGIFSPEGIFNLKLGVGANVMLMSGARFYFDLSSKFLGRIAPVLSISAGARIPIGSKHQRSLYYSPQSPQIYGSLRENNQN